MPRGPSCAHGAPCRERAVRPHARLGRLPAFLGHRRARCRQPQRRSRNPGLQPSQPRGDRRGQPPGRRRGPRCATDTLRLHRSGRLRGDGFRAPRERTEGRRFAGEPPPLLRGAAPRHCRGSRHQTMGRAHRPSASGGGHRRKPAIPPLARRRHAPYRYLPSRSRFHAFAPCRRSGRPARPAQLVRFWRLFGPKRPGKRRRFGRCSLKPPRGRRLRRCS